MSDALGPASHLGRRQHDRMTSAGPRPYPAPEASSSTPELALAAVRALVQAEDEATVRQVVATVIAAPEGEWHTLPSRLAAPAASDVRARALGPGLPAEHLQRYLELRGADLLALSCTMATNLLAAARSIQAAVAAGVPVVAGGRAFGSDGARALRLGADGWLGSARELGSFVPVRQQSVAPVPHEAVVADAVPDEVLLLALERQAAAAPWVRAMDERQRRHSLEDLRWVTRHAAAAHACDDPSLLDELLGWLDALLRDRGVPDRVLPDGAAYLADVLELQTPAVADLLRGAEARLR